MFILKIFFKKKGVKSLEVTTWICLDEMCGYKINNDMV